MASDTHLAARDL